MCVLVGGYVCYVVWMRVSIMHLAGFAKCFGCPPTPALLAPEAGVRGPGALQGPMNM